MSTNSGPLDPYLLPKYYNETHAKNPNHFKTYYFCISQNAGFPNFGKCWKRRAPRNDEAPFNKSLKCLDMGPICTRKHEWNFGRKGPISTRKHEMEFW